MFRPLSWILRKIAGRYDDDAFSLRPKMRDLEPSRRERILRWFFASPFDKENLTSSIFRRWVPRLLLLALYAFFLWLLYESYCAWGIFE